MIFNKSRRRKKLLHVAFVALMILITGQIAQADDWPMRGHDSMHYGTSGEIIEPPLELLWKYTTGGYVHSSPAVSNGIVYVGSDDSNIYAFDAGTGNIKWKYTTGGYVHSSPAVTGGIVYVGSYDSNIYAIDAATGILRWKYTTGGQVISSPAVSNRIVYVGSEDNNVYALDAGTGALKWKYDTSLGEQMKLSYIQSSPAVSGGLVYVGSYYNNAVYALDAETGALRWKYYTGGAVRSSPAVSGGTVYVGSYDNNIYALDAANGVLKWKYTTGSYVVSSPAISGRMVYVGSEDNNVYALDTASGALKWKYQTGSFIQSSPAISGDVLYVGSADGNVYALDATNGAFKWKYNTGKLVYSSPAIYGGMVYVGSDDNNLYAFGLKQTNWMLISASIFVVLLISVFFIRMRKSKESTLKTIVKPLPNERSNKKDVNIASAFGYKGATILYKIRVENTISAPIADVKVSLFIPDVFLLLVKEKSLALLKPGESKTITFEIRPSGECGDCEVSGRVTYYDIGSNRTKEIDIDSKMLSIVCPMLKVKEISESEWHNMVSNLLETEESTKEIDMPAETLFIIISRIIRDMHMHMLKPETTQSQQLFNGVARFYSEGIKSLRYAAQVEVVGGAKKSQLILKAWAEKEDALTGFYHGILGEIEKRINIKGYIDEPIVQYFNIAGHYVTGQVGKIIDVGDKSVQEHKQERYK